MPISPLLPRLGRIIGPLTIAAAALIGLTSPARAQAITEGFDTVTNGLPNASWATQNNSFMPALGYFQGNPTVFAANSGASNSYIGVDNESTSALDATGDTISNWLIAPTVLLNNGDRVSFFTRTVDAPAFADRLQFLLSANGASTDVGTLPGDVGDFTNLLLDINPTLDLTSYPNNWTQFSVILSGLSGPTSGRFAFRYFVTDGGPNGNNSDYIGIDDFAYTPVPEPGSMALIGAAAIGFVGYRRRRQAASRA